MRVKLFVAGGRGKPADHFATLEAGINDWLEAHPDVVIEHVHRISQPTFGWGQLGLAVWYRRNDAPGATG